MPVEYEDKPNIVQIDKSGNHVSISYGGPQGVQGPTGPTGPTGPAGITAGQIPALVSYTHNQSATSTTWTITHNLNFKPNVTVFDSAESMVEGSVTHTSNTTLSITFSAAISGRAHLS
jgi:cytoskeletal protein RodZ